MQIPVRLLLAELGAYPSSQIGVLGIKLAHLRQAHVPTYPLFLIPVQTLEAIAQHNQLAQKLESIGEAEDKTKKIQKLFQKISVPPHLADELLRTYQRTILSDLVKVILSPLEGVNLTQPLVQENIAGEANAFESLFELWGIAVNETGQLIPGAFIIQAQPQPTASGTAFTKNPDLNLKTQVLILSHWGATPVDQPESISDHFSVDVRTWNTVSSQLAHKTHQLLRTEEKFRSSPVAAELQNIPSLTENQLTHLAEYIQALKLQSLDHYTLSWEFSQGQWAITDFTPLRSAASEVESAPLPATHLAIASGTPVVSGIVQGTTISGRLPATPQQLSSETILVVKDFTPKLLAYLPRLVGLVVEKPLPSFALTQIKELHLPTVTHVANVLTRIKTGTSILIDANRGVIYPSAERSTTTHWNPTLTKLLISASNPAHAQEQLQSHVDGVIFKGDFMFAQQGVHPSQLLQTKAQVAFKQTLATALSNFKPTHTFPLLYRPVDLSSRELLDLRQAGPYEQAEANPYLGYRGAWRLTQQYELLDLELAALGELANNGHQRLGLMIPFTRTPNELRLLLSHLRHQTFISARQLEVWWQLCLPENIWQLPHYLSPQLTGIIISVKDLQALSLGIDPDTPDVYARYPVNVPLFRQLITDIQTQAPHHKIMLQLEHFEPSLAELAGELGLAGVMVKAADSIQAKQTLLETEERHVRMSHGQY